MATFTERDEAPERLMRALRGSFDASVMNFGSYNILYAANRFAAADQAPDDAAGSVQQRAVAAPHLLVGYRRQPVELVLCPVDLDEALARATGRSDAAPAPSVPVTVNLTNLAGLATDGTGVEVTFSTGYRVGLRMCSTVIFEQLPDARIEQRWDVEDFYEFIDFFMDTVEAQTEQHR